MNRSRSLLFLLTGLTCCGPAPLPDQYGPYPNKPAQMRLADGRVLPVYRIKYWEFEDGSAPALQLEYEAPFSVADTAAVGKMALAVWPAFRGLVDTLGLTNAIVTATNRQYHRFFVYNWSRRHSYGLVAKKAPDGTWHLENRPEPLPPRESPFANRFITAEGRPWPIAVVPPPIR